MQTVVGCCWCFCQQSRKVTIESCKCSSPPVEYFGIPPLQLIYFISTIGLQLKYGLQVLSGQRKDILLDNSAELTLWTLFLALEVAAHFFETSVRSKLLKQAQALLGLLCFFLIGSTTPAYCSCSHFLGTSFKFVELSGRVGGFQVNKVSFKEVTLNQKKKKKKNHSKATTKSHQLPSSPDHFLRH